MVEAMVLVVMACPAIRHYMARKTSSNSWVRLRCILMLFYLFSRILLDIYKCDTLSFNENDFATFSKILPLSYTAILFQERVESNCDTKICYAGMLQRCLW